MGDMLLGLNKTPHEDHCEHGVLLKKDTKVICHTQCLNAPYEVPQEWNLNISGAKNFHFPGDWGHCYLRPTPQCSRDQKEWRTFLHFLQKSNKVAFVEFDLCKFYIHPPNDVSTDSIAKVSYQLGNEAHLLARQSISSNISTFPMVEQFASGEDARVHGREPVTREKCSPHLRQSISPNISTFPMVEQFASGEDARVHGREPVTREKCSPQAIRNHNDQVKTCNRPLPHAVRRDEVLEKSYVRADPSYLKTLGQSHSGWIFGAIAELIDNSADAKATRLDISVDMIYSKRDGNEIPVLSVIDDGHGMTHDEVMTMTCFGHKQPDTDDPDHIGRFGIGFKTGSMRLGRDALVLTQTANSRTTAFLSQSLNEGKDNLEIPIISYHRRGQYMEVDTNIQSLASSKYNWKAVKEFSPFNKYLIGEKAGMFRGNSGTQIYIWNLDKWGSDYSLEWSSGLRGGSSFYQGDIFIRSRRIRSRPGQISKEVPLDYSLRSYLEVIFSVPRMKIYVQGSLIKSRPLAKSLNNTVVEIGNIMGKGVELTLGRSQLEWERANSGIFLYWHGRLIEAYKRVGGMMHNADISRGVIGVIDVTDLMKDESGCVWVHSNKQGFQDCELYALLEDWLCSKVDDYLDKNVDVLKLDKNVDALLCRPDYEWVQCDKCRKWRMLNSGFNSDNLPAEWFCFMEPFKGSCETPEQKVEPQVITVSTKRSGYNFDSEPLHCTRTFDASSEKSRSNDNLGRDVKHAKQLSKRRRLLPRACRKAS